MVQITFRNMCACGRAKLKTWTVGSETNWVFHMYSQWVLTLTSIRNTWLCKNLNELFGSETWLFHMYANEFWHHKFVHLATMREIFIFATCILNAMCLRICIVSQNGKGRNFRLGYVKVEFNYCNFQLAGFSFPFCFFHNFFCTTIALI